MIDFMGGGDEQKKGDKAKKGDGAWSYTERNMSGSNAPMLEKMDILAKANPQKFQDYDLDNDWNDEQKLDYFQNGKGTLWNINEGDQLNLSLTGSDPQMQSSPDNYLLQTGHEIPGAMESAGPVVYQWTQLEVKMQRLEESSGFWENSVELQTDWMGGWGIGDVAGSMMTLDISNDVLERLKTNSLVEVLNYGGHKVTSASGGMGFTQWALFKGYSESGELVWKMRSTVGFNVGVAVPGSSSNVKWTINENQTRKMTLQDSIRSAQMNYDAAKDDTSIYGNFLRTNIKGR